MFKLLLIWRYFVSKRVAWLAVLAVTLVVMMVLVVLSVMSGLLADTRGRNHRWSGDVVLSRSSLVGFPYYEEFISRLGGIEKVAQATPVIKMFGLAGSGNRAVELYGVRLDEFCQVTGFGETLSRMSGDGAKTFLVPKLEKSRWSSESELDDAQRRRGCIVGRYILSYEQSGLDMMREIWLGQPFGVTVFALSSKGLVTGSGTGEQQRFWYVDDSETGLPRIDDSAVYVDFDELARLCYMDGSDGGAARASEIRVRLKSGVGLEAGRAAVARAWDEFIGEPARAAGATRLLSDVKVATWPEYRRSQIAPAEKEKSVMVVVFAMLAVVGVFIIFAIFYMIVTEKIRDLGIIKSVGGSSWSVASVFLGYGALVGVIGAGLGTALGVAIVMHSNELEGVLNRHFGFRLWDPAVYAIDRIPDVVDMSQAVVIATVAVLASVLGAPVLPARRAAKLQVVEALRVE